MNNSGGDSLPSLTSSCSTRITSIICCEIARKTEQYSIFDLLSTHFYLLSAHFIFYHLHHHLFRSKSDMVFVLIALFLFLGVFIDFSALSLTNKCYLSFSRYLSKSKWRMWIIWNSQRSLFGELELQLIRLREGRLKMVCYFYIFIIWIPELHPI